MEGRQPLADPGGLFHPVAGGGKGGVAVVVVATETGQRCSCHRVPHSPGREHEAARGGMVGNGWI